MKLAAVALSLLCTGIALADGPRQFALGEVELTGGVLLEKRDIDEKYLLEVVDADRLLAEFRRIAGLPAKAVRYPNRWEGGQITGHSLGHYLSAVSALYAVKKSPAAKTKADYIVAELKALVRESLRVQPGPGRFYDKTYSVPAELLKGKKTVEIRFAGTQGTTFVRGVFGVRFLR